MRHALRASQALRLAAEQTRQPYICRSCLAQASRQMEFSTSTPRNADDLPFYKRIQNSIFGTKESKQAEQSREEKRKRRLDEVAKREKGELETKTDGQGRTYEFAEVVDPTTHNDYVSATTWDGLESVGGEQWVKQRADMGEQYFGFMLQKKAQLNNAQWEQLLHHIAVEVLTLQKAGRDVLEICNARTPDRQNCRRTAQTVISIESNDLKYAEEKDEEKVLSSILPPGETWEVLPQQSLMNELRRATAGSKLSYEDNASWMAVRVEDPIIKFAILKRTMQLTGKRVPDPAISNAITLADLCNAFKVKEKPKKLSQDPKVQSIAQEVPSVKIHGSRRTPVHKEKEIGRWKIIEDELVLRDLPVFGSRYQGAKEGFSDARK